MTGELNSSRYPLFDRSFFESDQEFSIIGAGELGGKALGLASAKRVIDTYWNTGAFPEIHIGIPRMTVVTTDVFEEFMRQNELYDVVSADSPDDRIAQAFVKAELPPRFVGDLRALIEQVHSPLAIRSSSLLEDALQHPFAGVYATKMIPNNQNLVGDRFRKLADAIKFVWASTFFQDARNYMQAIGQSITSEKMAVIIQEVVGERFNERFYPIVSGVIRTHNCYPSGPADAEDGVVNLALGLGKTIVDGGVTWSYSPGYPNHYPPFGSIRDLVDNTQNKFWAVSMEKATYDPVNESEHLVRSDLDVAEWDDVLRFTASTYDRNSDRLTLGTGQSGTRVLTFGRILELNDIPLNDLIKSLSETFKKAYNAEVEIEFALTFDRQNGLPARLGFLQVRPMMVADDLITLSDVEFNDQQALVATETALGNGQYSDIVDVVYIKPSSFEAKYTTEIAGEIASMNRDLVSDNRAYLLIGFGRWGSSDPWLGVPLTWPQISGARAIVEATLPEMNVDASQGSHFFHNMNCFRVLYFTVRHSEDNRIDWEWLDRQPAITETRFLRHVRINTPLNVRVDGRSGRGVILRD